MSVETLLEVFCGVRAEHWAWHVRAICLKIVSRSVAIEEHWLLPTYHLIEETSFVSLYITDSQTRHKHGLHTGPVFE